MLTIPWLFLASMAFPAHGFALGLPKYVETTPAANSFRLVHEGAAATLYADSGDEAGVLRATRDLQADIFKVSGCKAPIDNEGRKLSGDVVLIGTLGKSRLVDRLVREHKIDASQIEGKWESTLIQVVPHPLPGVARGLVIAGSDKRGTIYGIYDLSQQIGVSPWYWWADVPVKHQDALYIQSGRWVEGEPAVKYRGIFLNDEAPALTGWVSEKYGGFNHQFYEKVFELLLRLKANFLWPAMWTSAFSEDDPLNPKLADEYGIVMGTSHHEPMLRAQQEWKRHGEGAWNYSTNGEELREFWTKAIERNANYESAITLGMRGDGDMPMSETDDVALLQKIVADQRAILAAHATPTLKSDPEVWALYKEVQGYYEKGMRVPDDVTLLWCDDNWGNIRRLPTPEERRRSGGAGIYYHFDYVGDPRSYKWLGTYPLPKVWEQMNLALRYDARRIWIVNVGDLKPMEMPIEFLLDLARVGTAMTQHDVAPWTRDWAARQFGAEHAEAIAQLLAKYTQLNGRRKPEQLEPDTWSLLRDGEADRVDAEWKELTAQAKAVQAQLPPEMQAAYFELVLYPLQASATVNEMYIAVGRNHLWADQGRRSANDAAEEARRRFAEDARLSDEYNHALLGGKWDHMMDQTHIGYTFWNEPPLNSMPAVHYVQPRETPHMGVAVEGSAFAQTGGGGFPLVLPAFDSLNRQTRSITLFNAGVGSFQWTAKADAPWVRLSAAGGTVNAQSELRVEIDWAQAPAGTGESAIHIAQINGPTCTVRVRARKPAAVDRSNLAGFAEIGGTLSIEAGHTTGIARGTGPMHWEPLPGYGETLSAMTVFPVDAESAPAPSAALQYRVYFDDAGAFQADFVLAPTLSVAPGRGLRFAVGVDDAAPVVADALAHNSDQDWAKAVSDGVRHVTLPVTILSPGYHTLAVYAVDPGVVLEKIVLRQPPARRPGPFANARDSYLGPPESYHAGDGLGR
jgi:hypothetical protein